MKRHSFGDIARFAAETWTWYILKGYSCDLDYIRGLGKFELIIGHDESTNIPACPLLENYHYSISDEIVTKGHKLYSIDLFL